MLYNFTIFSKGGIILWRKNIERLSGDPISDLVRDVILQEKHNQTVFNKRINNMHYNGHKIMFMIYILYLLFQEVLQHLMLQIYSIVFVLNLLVYIQNVMNLEITQILLIHLIRYFKNLLENIMNDQLPHVNLKILKKERK